MNKLRPNRKTGIFKLCLICNGRFYIQKHRIKTNPQYCSPVCYGVSKKGNSPWNKGTKGLIKSNKGSFIKIGVKFEGTISQYKALHHKIGKMLGKPSICENCGKSGLNGRLIHWANISGNYLLIKTDWIRLCRACHYEFDKVEERRAKNARNLL